MSTPEAPPRRRRARKKTWSALGELGRRPNDYEIVTHNMNHTTGETPLEMGPNVHGNVWLKKYRDGMALRVERWDDFRDPDRVTYDSYVKMQDEAESFVDQLLESFTAEEPYDEELSSDCLGLLAHAVTPQRYLVHAQQMVAAYVQQLAPSSYVGNCAAFQAADHLRRVQRIAYRTKQLDSAHPTRGFGSTERSVWEEHPKWQPTREAMEKLLTTYTWDEAFVASNLIIRPVLDEIFLRQASLAARAAGDELDALVLENLHRDSQRHDRWSKALVDFLVDAHAENRAHVRRFGAAWSPLAESIVQSGAALLAEHVPDLSAEAIAHDVRTRIAEQRLSIGLGAEA